MAFKHAIANLHRHLLLVCGALSVSLFLSPQLASHFCCSEGVEERETL